MAVYNPYDQVIFEDPAYLTDPEKVKEQLQEETRGIADIVARTAGPIAGLVTNPEKYQQTLDQEQRNKQILEQLGITNRQLNRDEMERAKAAGYVPLTTGQALGKISGFLYSDLVKGSENIRAGVDYYDLPENERMGVAMGLIDITDIALLPAVFKKLATLGVKKFGKSNLKTMAQDPELQKQFPAETQEILSITGGGFTPAGVVREPETGGAKGSNQSEVQVKKINDTIEKIKSGDLEPNLGPNKYGLNKIRANEILRGERKTNQSLNVPLEEAQSLIKNVSTVKKIENFLSNSTEKFTRKQLEDKFKTNRSTVSEAIKNANANNKILTAEVISTSKYATPAERVRNIATLMNQNKKELGLTKSAKTFGDDREEFVLFDGIFRSLEPQNLGLTKDVDKKIFAEKFIDFMKGIDWKKNFAEDLDSIKILDKQRIQGDKIIKEMFDDYRKRFPKQFKDLDYKDFKLNVAHNFPLRVIKGQFEGVGGMKGSSRLTFARTNLGSHAEIENTFKELLSAINQQNGKITPAQQEILTSIDDRAKKLGTVAYGKINQPGLENEFIKVGTENAPGITSLIESVENYFKDIAGRKKTKFKKFEPKGGATNLVSGFIDEDIPVEIIDELKMKKGGEVKPVKMAIGGDPLINMNQQQFTPDPAFEGEDYFQQAVESGNLQAFNPGKIFKLFNKTDAVYTPKKLPDPVAEQQAAPPGTTLPTTQTVQPEDFAFQSFTLNKINDPQAPKAGTPEAWKQFLYGGGQGGKVPEAEMLDTGLEQYLNDYAKYYPDQKITKQQLTDYYEMSPIGNIEIKVKASRGADFAPHSPSAEDPAYKGYVGGAQHKEQGSQPLDSVGTDYREIVVKAGALPGDKKPFVASGHYQEENVLGFTRVADYLQPNGGKVAVIQEMQTDMLTKVRKEQERLQALLKRIENIKAKAARELQSGDPYREAGANRALEELNKIVPPTVEEALKKHQDLIKPFPNEAAKSTIPDYQKKLSDLQLQIEDVLQKDIQQNRPETGFEIQDIAKEQQNILDSLLDLNRSGQLEDMLKNVEVPSTRETDRLLEYGTDTNVRGLNDGVGYGGTKPLELFPPIPFNKQADYVDLLIKSTIKDAQAREIDKVAIYPPDLVNQRWGKSPDSDAGKKFRDLYGKVAIQQMKNIAKKYGGTAKVETIINPNASDRGLTYYKTNVDGEYEFMKQDQLAQGLEPEEAQLFIDEQLNRNAHALGDKQVIYSREVAPGQTMDYYVDPYVVNTDKESIKKYNLVPLGPGDDRNAAQVLIEEYNPQEVQMFTITLDSDKAKGPMFMFKKKSGGSIDKDSLVSITDIYGEYGR